MSESEDSPYLGKVDCNVAVDLDDGQLVNAIQNSQINPRYIESINKLLSEQLGFNEKFYEQLTNISASSDPAIYVSISSVLVAMLACGVAYRQYLIAKRTERQNIYNVVLKSLRYLAKYKGKPDEEIDEAYEVLITNREIARIVFGSSAKELIDKALHTAQQLPAGYSIFKGVYGEEIEDFFEQFGLDPKATIEHSVEQYKQDRVWLSSEIFKEFENTFKI